MMRALKWIAALVVVAVLAVALVFFGNFFKRIRHQLIILVRRRQRAHLHQRRVFRLLDKLTTQFTRLSSRTVSI